MLCFATVFLCIRLATTFAGSNLSDLCQLPEPQCQFGQRAECKADGNGNLSWVCQQTLKKKSSSKHTSARNAPKLANKFWMNSISYGSQGGSSPLTPGNPAGSSGFGNVPTGFTAGNGGLGNLPAGFAAGNSGFGNAAAAQRSGAPAYASEFWMNSANFGSPGGNSPLTAENAAGMGVFGNVPAGDAASNSGFGNTAAGYAAGNSGFRNAAAAQRSGAPGYASEFWLNSANSGSPGGNPPLTAETPAGNPSGFGNVPTGFTAENGGLGNVPAGLAVGSSGFGNAPAGFAAGNNAFGNASSGDTTGKTGFGNSPAGYAGSNSGFDNAPANNLAGIRSRNVFGNAPSASNSAGYSGLGNAQNYAAGNMGFGNRPTGYAGNSDNGLRTNPTGFTPNAGGLPGASSNLDLAALQMALGAQPAAGARNGNNGGLLPGFSSNSGESLGQLQEGALQNQMPSFSGLNGFGAPPGGNQPYSPILPNGYGSSPAVNGYPTSQPSSGLNLGFSARNGPMTLDTFDSPAGYNKFGQPPVVTGTFGSSQPKIPLNDLKNVLRLQKAEVPRDVKIRLNGSDLLKTLGLSKRHGHLNALKFSGRSAGTGKAALISADIAAQLQRSARKRSEEIKNSRKKD